MPTGYTSTLYEGEQSLRDFILLCSRGFGALIHQRDEDSSAPPRLREPSTYSLTVLETAKRSLAVAEAWTEEDAARKASMSYDKAYQGWSEDSVRRAAIVSRYEDMLAKVEKWEPPTPEHVELKGLMLSQLKESIKFGGSYPAPEAQTGSDYKAGEIARAQRSIEYYTKNQEEEYARVEGANGWIKALYASLPEES